MSRARQVGCLLTTDNYGSPIGKIVVSKIMSNCSIFCWLT